MGWLSESLNSSIGKKIIMAVTGTFLIVFLTVHLLGNLALFANDGGKSFNAYAEFLQGMKFTVYAEIGLALLFVFHIFNGLRLWLENKKARPISYKVDGSSQNSSIFSRTMVLTGSTVGAFLVLHLYGFYYIHKYVDTTKPLFDLVQEAFQNHFLSWFYVLAVMLLAFHLNHGFQSAFQTFGWTHKKYTPVVKIIGTVFSIIIGLGFASMPIYFMYFCTGGK